MTQPTDTQLKQALAKMLPDTLLWDDEASQHNTDRPQDEAWGLCWDSGNPVLDTELLHLCCMVEETLTPEQQVDYYNFRLRASTNNGCVDEYKMIRATWQQRTIALAKVLNIEIV